MFPAPANRLNGEKKSVLKIVTRRVGRPAAQRNLEI
jgi:hypothetical protein